MNRYRWSPIHSMKLPEIAVGQLWENVSKTNRLFVESDHSMNRWRVRFEGYKHLVIFQEKDFYASFRLITE